MPLVNVKMRKQRGNNTCWATCAQMVLETYGYTEGTSQSAVIKTILGTLADEQGTPTEVGGAVAKLSGKRVFMKQVDRALTIDELKALLSNSCVVVADVGSHVVLVHGVGNTSGKIWISDPDPMAQPKEGEERGAEVLHADFLKKWKCSAAVVSWQGKNGGAGSTDLKA